MRIVEPIILFLLASKKGLIVTVVIVIVVIVTIVIVTVVTVTVEAAEDVDLLITLKQQLTLLSTFFSISHYRYSYLRANRAAV